MGMEFRQAARAVQRQAMVIGAKQIQGLALLQKSLPELRQQLVAEISNNPVLEELEHPLETPLSAVERFNDHEASESMPDYPEGDYQPTLNFDEEAAERRQAFFDNQVKKETLQDHLLAQLSLSDMSQAERQIAYTLIGDLNDDGFYKGSIPDVCMSFNCTETDVRRILRLISELDPAGCGATTARECLLAQIDKLDGSENREIVRKMIDCHLEDIAAGHFDRVCTALGISRKRYAAALHEMRTLSARPGAEYPCERDRVEYVNPEVHAVRREGYWYAVTDRRSLPELHISPKYLAMLKDPATSEETRQYVHERIDSVRALQEAIAKRQETIDDIAQALFDHQQEFFTRGFQALKPLTEIEIAKEVGVDPSTVSRTITGKYASTPFGTVELRRFCVTAVKTASGDVFVRQNVVDKLKEIVDGEDKSDPLSDLKLTEALNAAGYHVVRRTVAKYRSQLGIPGVFARKNSGR